MMEEAECFPSVFILEILESAETWIWRVEEVVLTDSGRVGSGWNQVLDWIQTPNLLPPSGGEDTGTQGHKTSLRNHTN